MFRRVTLKSYVADEETLAEIKMREASEVLNLAQERCAKLRAKAEKSWRTRSGA